jgi:hypothetical protein
MACQGKTHISSLSCERAESVRMGAWNPSPREVLEHPQLRNGASSCDDFLAVRADKQDLVLRANAGIIADAEGLNNRASAHLRKTGALLKPRNPEVREWILSAPTPALVAMGAHGLYTWESFLNGLDLSSSACASS